MNPTDRAGLFGFSPTVVSARDGMISPEAMTSHTRQVPDNPLSATASIGHLSFFSEN